MPKFLLMILLIVFALNLSAIPCQADWIHAEFSEAAGIDSIERFLVIQDIDSSRIIGDPIVPLGDINGDGCSDVILVRKAAGCLDTNSSFLCYGGSPPDGVFDQVFTRFRIIAANIGDINSDGFDDMANFQCIPDWRTEILLGGATLDDSADFIIPGTLSFLCRAADLDNDGSLELPLSTNVNGGYVNIYQTDAAGVHLPAEYTIPDTSRDFGGNLAAGDFNGDGYPDLAVAAYLNRDSSFVKFYWGGPTFDTIPDFEIWRIATGFGRILVPLGDFNGDGYEDILIDGGVADGWSIPGGVFFGGPYIDNTLDIVTNRYTLGGYLCARSADLAGDVNHDGYPDLIVGTDNFYAFQYEAKVFLGGPDADSIPDIYLENRQMPGGQIDFGAVVVGIGDFNGDGIDDFAARSRTESSPYYIGEVNFFAGWDSNISDVDEDDAINIPSRPELKQNYPNPFNARTTIEFYLPRSGYTEIIIFNLLGEEVAVPLRQHLPAGEHRATWDGLDKDGNTVPTGIYFYQISSGDYTRARKMILLK